jgi:hypothetical protein
MTRLPFRHRARASLTVLAVLAFLLLSSVACKRLVYSIWYEVSCGGFGMVPNGFLAETFGIEYHGPERSFAVADLLLDESAFPDGWLAGGEPYDPEDRMPAEQIAVDFFIHECPFSLRAGHDVYRFYGGSRCAEMGYRLKTPVWFAPRDGWGPWAVPAELSYESRAADEYRLSCYTHQESGTRTCQAVGRFEEYVVRFLTPMSPNCMTFADLERILVAIDERTAFYLGKDMP